MDNFFQKEPQLGNTFSEDRFLRSFLAWRLPKNLWTRVSEDLTSLGEKARGEYLQLAIEAERDVPEHVPYNEWGHRIDQIRVSSAWHRLHQAAATEGLVAIAYARAEKEWSRLYQFAKLYLFHPSSAFYSCPLAMTDGAAKVLETFGSEPLKSSFLSHLVSRDPKEFWTSGQWMTEKAGGSDLGGSECEAISLTNGLYGLHGVKWFCSATTSPMALALGRCEGDSPGSRGLSLFAVKAFNSDGSWNKVRVLRLKNKLGTRALPTAELELQGTPAHLLGERGRGIHTAATMLNITRLHNSVCAVAHCSRLLQWVLDYSGQRYAFARPVKEQGLFVQVLSEHYMAWALGAAMTFELAVLLGREELGMASDSESALLRLLTPIAKAYTGKMALSFCSELLECFGGVGYVEDSRVPTMFRDAQVFSIWEGTTNILSLDVLRALGKDLAGADLFLSEMRLRLDRLKSSSLAKDHVMKEWQKLGILIEKLKGQTKEELQINSRALAWNLGQLFAATVLLEMAENQSQASLKAWCSQLMSSLSEQPLVRHRLVSVAQIDAGRNVLYSPAEV